jgi:hypothetical protein
MCAITHQPFKVNIKAELTAARQAGTRAVHFSQLANRIERDAAHDEGSDITNN